MAAIALADHDNIDGIDRAIRAGQEQGIEVIPAVELSTQWFDYRDMHLLGYGFDHRDPYLIRALDEFQAFRRTRNRQIIERVNVKLESEHRAPLEPETVQTLAGGTIGRPHIAQALRQVGYVKNNDEAFERYLVPCNVPKRYFPVDEAINLIHHSGGSLFWPTRRTLPVIAINWSNWWQNSYLSGWMGWRLTITVPAWRKPIGSSVWPESIT